MTKSKKREICEICSNIFVSFIGAGVLGLPYAFMRSGLLEGTIVMAFVAYMSIQAMLLLVDCKHRVNLVLGNGNLPKIRVTQGKDYSPLKVEDFDPDDDKSSKSSSRSMSPMTTTADGISYGDVGFAAFGHAGRLIVDFTVIFSQLGFCCSYLIFIKENLSNIWPNVSQNHWLAVTLPFAYFLSLIPDLKKLAIGSFIAQVSNCMAFLVVIWFDLSHFQEVFTEKDHIREFSLDGFPFFFSIAIYCYEGAGMILSLEDSVPNHIRSSFKRLFVMTLTVVTLLYIAFGVLGYWSYGPHTEEIITLNLPHKNAGFDFAILVKFCLCTSLIFTYPVMMFPVTKLFRQRIQDWSSAGCIDTNDMWFGAALRLVLVTLTGLIVLLVPNFSDMMSLIGATCCTLLAFIMPACCHITLFRNDLKKSQMILDGALVIIGATAMIMGTHDTYITMKNRKSGLPVKSI